MESLATKPFSAPANAPVRLQILQHIISAGSPLLCAAERTRHVAVGAGGHSSGRRLRGGERGAASHRVQNQDNGVDERGVGWD